MISINKKSDFKKDTLYVTRAKIGFEAILKDKLLKNTYPFDIFKNFIEISMKGP